MDSLKSLKSPRVALFHSFTLLNEICPAKPGLAASARIFGGESSCRLVICQAVPILDSMTARGWTVRGLILVAITPLIAWLVWSPSSDDTRIDRINAALINGPIGHLDHENEEKLQKTVEWLFAAAGFSGSVTVDKPYSKQASSQGVLQVLVTTPETSSFTSCGPGNAVYDAELDAIFIDKEIVIPTDWQKLLATPDGRGGLDIPLGLNDAPWLWVYARFVILHEIGHRKLHRHAATSFDVRSSGASDVLRKMEGEADEFAVARMNDAYPIASKFGVVAVEQYTGDTINYSVKPSMPIPDQVQASLVEMAQAIASGRLALPSTTPLFRDDYAHPSYLDRAQGLVRESLRRTDINPDLRLYSQYVDNSFARLQEARQSGMIEVTADKPIGGIIFDERGMIVVLSGVLYRVPYAELQKLLQENKPISLDAAGADKFSHPLQGFLDHGEKLVGYWSAQGVGTLLLWSDGMESVIAPDFKSATSRSAVVGASLTFESVVTSPQPSDDAVALAADSSNKARVTVFHKNKLALNVGLDELTQSCVPLGAPSNSKLDLEFAQVTDGLLFMPVIVPTNDQYEIYGYAQFGLKDLRPIAVSRLMIPKEMATRTSAQYNALLSPVAGDRELVFEHSNSQTKAILVNIVRRQSTDRVYTGPGVKWQTWELYSDHSPRLLQEGNFLVDYFNQHLSPAQVDNLAITPRLPPHGVQFVAPDKVLINIDNDSIYLTGEKSHKIVFHPGSDTISTQQAANGMVAVFVRSAYRAFVLRNVSGSGF
jgi:hypothetical protein